MLILSDSKHKNCRRNGIVHFFYHQQLYVYYLYKKKHVQKVILLLGAKTMLFLSALWYKFKHNTIGGFIFP
jgi:hypothetical protein